MLYNFKKGVAVLRFNIFLHVDIMIKPSKCVTARTIVRVRVRTHNIKHKADKLQIIESNHSYKAKNIFICNKCFCSKNGCISIHHSIVRTVRTYVYARTSCTLKACCCKFSLLSCYKIDLSLSMYLLIAK